MIQSRSPKNEENRIKRTGPVVCTPYETLPGVRDEVWDENGRPRKHWEAFVRALEGMACDELGKSQQEMIRLLRENGIACNIHGDPQGIHRHFTADIAEGHLGDRLPPATACQLVDGIRPTGQVVSAGGNSDRQDCGKPFLGRAVRGKVRVPGPPMIYRVAHRTEYAYNGPVSLCHNEVRLVPRDMPRQKLVGRQISVEPTPSAFREREDFFGNRVCYFSVQQPHEVLVISVASSVRLAESESPVGFSASLPWEEAKRRLREENTPEMRDARQFAFDSPMVSTSGELSEYAGLSFSKGSPILEACNDLMGRIYREFEFTSGFTTVSTPLAYVLEHRKGVCQDFSHLAVGCLRSLGLAARYVSGYIETLPPPGKEKLKGADVSHAWFSAFAPGIGWIDFDPTNNLIPADRHVVTAWGRDFSDVTPVKGIVFSGGGHRLSVSVDVERR